MGSVEKGSRPTAEIIVQNYGREPLVLRRVSSSDSSVTVKTGSTKIKAGKQAVIKITVDTDKVSDTRGLINSKLSIIANDPQRPVSGVRIVGEIIEK